MSEDRSVLTRPAPPPEVTASYGDAPDHVIDYWFSERGDECPLAVLVHGGFWRPTFDRTHLRPMANAVCAAGWDVAAIEYRRLPGDPDVTVGDVGAALAAAPRLAAEAGGGRPADRPVITAGHSAGGHLVLWAAAKGVVPGLAGTVALAPAADLVLAHRLGLGEGAAEAFCGTDPSERPDLDPCRLPSPSTPVVTVHGTDDEIVPLSLSEAYRARHPASRLVPIVGAGHFALIDPLSAAWPIVLAELERLG